MAGTINTGNISRSLELGIHKHFGQAYETHEKQYDKIFDIRSSNRAFEIDQQFEGFGLASVKPQGAGIEYDAQQEGISPKYIADTIAKGFIVTMEALNDQQYDLFGKGARGLAYSINQTKETRCANVINRAFNSSFIMTDGDGLELLSTVHVNGPSDSTTFSNELATPAALSEATLEELLIQINEATDPRGLKIALQGTRLIVPPKLMYEACRITDSVLQNDTANNAVNALKYKGSLKDGYTVNNYLSSQTAWFVKTNCPEGLTHFEREAVMFGRDRDFGTMNVRFQGYERYSQGWSDARGLYGSAGV